MNFQFADRDERLCAPRGRERWRHWRGGCEVALSGGHRVTSPGSPALRLRGDDFGHSRPRGVIVGNLFGEA